MSEDLFRKLKPVSMQTSQFRGSPKIHISGVLLLPCMQNFVYLKFARCLAHILSPVREKTTQHCLKDSFQLSNTLDQLAVSSQKMCFVRVDTVFQEWASVAKLTHTEHWKWFCGNHNSKLLVICKALSIGKLKHPLWAKTVYPQSGHTLVWTNRL